MYLCLYMYVHVCVCMSDITKFLIAYVVSRESDLTGKDVKLLETKVSVRYKFEV